MVTVDEAKQAVRNSTSGAELGFLLAYLSSVPCKELAGVDTCGGTTAVAAYVRSKAAAAAGVEPGSTAADGIKLVLKKLDNVLIGQEKFMKEQEKSTKEQKKFMKKQMKEQKKITRELVYDIMRLSYPPRSASSRSGDTRSTAMKAYGVKVEANMVRCMAANVNVPDKDAIAGHILQPHWCGHAEEITGVELDSIDNIIFMHKAIERKFGNYQIIIIPLTEDLYMVHVLDPSIDRKSLIMGGAEIKWQDLERRLITFTTVARPSAKCCAFHAKIALQDAERKKWLKKVMEEQRASQWMGSKEQIEEQIDRPAIEQAANANVPTS
ncbi:hypothetical protein TSOC_005541 [Tetrabaena socialis]|uniref:HNH nuclease domain-containing protein n=1 Tax=Tetrabaena socialis TaxID=47790 RepID=A0A2J8A5Z9_9CHLO|nr:hypothetical protein TSOC_005541 [Tetrabaena socialis]|eukprot:PNH07956.1 hypothetical protein TSOC_005541 [Tetrabaena socialis]